MRLTVEPLDLRAGFDTALSQVIEVSSAGHPHHAYLFANRPANRLKVLVHERIGIWLAARRLNHEQFVWPHVGIKPKHYALTREQIAGLMLGLWWQSIATDCQVKDRDRQVLQREDEPAG